MYGRAEPARYRRYVRGAGLGQCVDPGSGDDVSCDTPGSIAYTPSSPTLTPVPVTSGPLSSGYLTSSPSSPAPPASSGLLNPGSATDVGGMPYGSIGSQGGCASGYVVGDAEGNCVPAAQLLTALSTPAGATAFGLTPSQAAAITAALKAATVAVGGSVSTSGVVPVSTNPLSSISPAMWMAGAAALVLVLILAKKR